MRGPRPTTLRGRAAGGREARAWLSAAEHAALVAYAATRGVSPGDALRGLLLAATGTVCPVCGAIPHEPGCASLVAVFDREERAGR